MKPDLMSDGWRRGAQLHMLRLTLIRPKPELYRVEHRIVGAGGEPETHRTLFYSRVKAEALYADLRTNPPTTYRKE